MAEHRIVVTVCLIKRVVPCATPSSAGAHDPTLEMIWLAPMSARA
jgi:hypothetical protein